MAARIALKGEHQVLRFAPLSKRFIDPETAEPLGPSPAAFALRDEDKGGLSVTEVEHFGGTGLAARVAAACAYRSSQPSKKLGAKGAFARAQVSIIVAAGNAYKKKLRVVHDPVLGNPGHAEIRHFTDDDLDLLDYIATAVFVEYDVVADMNLPV